MAPFHWRLLLHNAVREFLAECAVRFKHNDIIAPYALLDVGGLDVNGNPRDLFFGSDPYITLDIAQGPNVDIVADAATWTPDREYDVVVSCEVFEHTPQWPKIVETCYRALRVGGAFIATCASIGRGAHDAYGAPEIPLGQYYGNVSITAFSGVPCLDQFLELEVTKTRHGDLQVWGIKHR